MTTRSEAEINRLPALTAAEYVDEERAAAEEESQTATASTVFSVRLQPAVSEAVKTAAGRAHLTPSALIRQWVTERVEAAGEENDLASEDRRSTATPSANTRNDRIKGLSGEYLGIDALHHLADLDETNAHRADGTYTSVLVHPSIRDARPARVIAARPASRSTPSMVDPLVLGSIHGRHRR